MSNQARHHKACADAIEVQINALDLYIRALKRERDTHREMEKFFMPPGTPLPPIVPPPVGPDPDYDEQPAGQEPGPAQQQDEAAP